MRFDEIKLGMEVNCYNEFNTGKVVALNVETKSVSVDFDHISPEPVIFNKHQICQLYPTPYKIGTVVKIRRNDGEWDDGKIAIVTDLDTHTYAEALYTTTFVNATLCGQSVNSRCYVRPVTKLNAEEKNAAIVTIGQLIRRYIEYANGSIKIDETTAKRYIDTANTYQNALKHILCDM